MAKILVSKAVALHLLWHYTGQLTDKMLDSDVSFDILSDIKPYCFEPVAKKVTDSINYEELAAASLYVDPEQPPVWQR